MESTLGRTQIVVCVKIYAAVIQTAEPLSVVATKGIQCAFGGNPANALTPTQQDSLSTMPKSRICTDLHVIKVHGIN